MANGLGAAIRPELIWLASEVPGVPLEAFLHLLAGAIATDLDDPTAIVTLGATVGPEALIWRSAAGRFEDAGVVLSAAAISERDLEDLLGPPPVRGRVFVTNPADPLSPSPRLAGVQFDRIVYVADTIPPAVPAAIAPRLRNVLLRAGTPLFSSFITSVLLPAERESPAGLLALLAPFLRPAPFRTRAAQDRRVGRARRLGPPSPEIPIFRDACPIRLDPVSVQAEFTAWLNAGGLALPEPFVDWVGAGAAHPRYAETASRWGRAVTNRRVGVALSGGGACAYRIGPVLWKLHGKNIPVDVFTGLSGGGLVGAYYCQAGLGGLATVVGRGPLFFLGLPTVVVSTWPFQAFVDWDLDGTRVEELDVRFAAVTTVMPGNEPLESAFVAEGTLGEAVRASGTLPPMFAPTVKNGIRYTDGGAASAVPAQVARDCGADVVLSCNAIPGPERGNPLGDWLLGRLLHDYTPVGRLIDVWAWRAFQWYRSSQQFGVDADVFLEFDLQRMPLIESVVGFLLSWTVVAQAQGEDLKLTGMADELKDAWDTLGRPPPAPVGVP